MTDIQKEPKKQELIESNNEDEELNAFFDRINSRNSKCVVLCMDTIGEYLKDLNEREKLSLNVNENKTELNKKVESQKCAWKPVLFLILIFFLKNLGFYSTGTNSSCENKIHTAFPKTNEI